MKIFRRIYFGCYLILTLFILIEQLKFAGAYLFVYFSTFVYPLYLIAEIYLFYLNKYNISIYFKNNFINLVGIILPFILYGVLAIYFAIH